MEAVDPGANGVEDDASSVAKLPSMTTVNRKMTATAFDDEPLRRYIRGVRVLGCALQGKKELRILRDLFPDIDLSPDDTGDDHTASTDGPKVTPGDETMGDSEVDIEGNIEGVIEAEYVATSPEDENEGGGEDRAEGAVEDIEPIGEFSELQGVCEKECLTGLVNQPTLTQPCGTCRERDVSNMESEITELDLYGDVSKTGLEANEGKVYTVNTLENPETYDMEALITPVISSSKVLPHKKIPANVRSIATITNSDNSFATTYLKHQEFSSLKIQVQELKKVNIEWKNHMRQKISEFKAELSKKNLTIGRLQTQLDDAVKEADMKENQYDQTLLTAKARIEKIKDENRGLKKDICKEQQKSEKSERLNRTLIKQNLNMTDEIVRLKQALEKKYHQLVHENQSPSIKQSKTSEPKTGLNDDTQQEPNIVERDTQTHLSTTVPMPLKAPADEAKQDVRRTASQNVQEVSEKKKHPKENMSKVTDKSLSKQDMKEQVELLRQQNQMYESDFKKERADRQKARNELHTLRHQLSKQKTHTTGQIKDDIKTQQGPPKHGIYSSADQKLESESTPRRDHNKLKAKPIRRTDKDVVKHGQKAIKVSGSHAIIIQSGPEGRELHINLQAESDTVRGRSRIPTLYDPYVCPRCQKMFTESEWDSFEHHVTLCTR